MKELIAYGSNIILKEVKEDDKKDGFLILPDKQQNWIKAEVVSVGKNVDETIKEGSKLIISKYAHVEFHFNGKDYLICKNDNIYANVFN